MKKGRKDSLENGGSAHSSHNAANSSRHHVGRNGDLDPLSMLAMGEEDIEIKQEPNHWIRRGKGFS